MIIKQSPLLSSRISAKKAFAIASDILIISSLSLTNIARNEPIRCMLTLKELAIHLIKITSDLRLLSSGPRTGLAEIMLPPVQPGSTIMPGKVNPAILEMTYMVCCQIIGYETAIATVGIAGQLEINVMMPVIAHIFLHSIDLLTNAIQTLVTKCISGIQADEENKTIKQILQEKGLLTDGIINAIDPKGMV
ncbi:MAG: hypothetical protein JJT76_00175 [Clostridiaceae bacterium]|nr:hypothetical protein [Clostridiaceae bacterium]